MTFEDLIPERARREIEETAHVARDLPEPEPERPLSDPSKNEIGKFHADPHSTEIASALDVYPRTGTQRRRVLEAIAAAGERGCTDRELQLGLGIRRARTRRDELVEGGWVCDSGRMRPQADTKNPAKIWVLTERAKDALRSAA